MSPVDIVQAGTGIGKLVPAAEASREVLSLELRVESSELVLQKPALHSHGFDERLRDDEVAQRVVVFRELLGEHGIKTASCICDLHEEFEAPAAGEDIVLGPFVRLQLLDGTFHRIRDFRLLLAVFEVLGGALRSVLFDRFGVGNCNDGKVGGSDILGRRHSYHQKGILSLLLVESFRELVQILDEFCMSLFGGA